MTNTLDSKGKQAFKELFQLIEESGLTLSGDIEFENDQRTIIQVVDNAAEYNDESFLYESYSASDVFDWLKVNRHLK